MTTVYERLRNERIEELERERDERDERIAGLERRLEVLARERDEAWAELAHPAEDKNGFCVVCSGEVGPFAHNMGDCIVELKAQAGAAASALHERDERIAELERRLKVLARERDEALSALRQVPTEYYNGEWHSVHCLTADGPEPLAVVAYAAEPSPETGHVGGWRWWAMGSTGDAPTYEAACDAAELALRRREESALHERDEHIAEPERRFFCEERR